MSRAPEFSDAQSELIAPMIPQVTGHSRPFRDHRQVVEGIVFRVRTGCAWRDMQERSGPWQTVWKQHAQFSRDGTWDEVFAMLLAQADAAGDVDWAVSIDSTINRAHQHATAPPRTTGDCRITGICTSIRVTTPSVVPVVGCHEDPPRGRRQGPAPGCSRRSRSGWRRTDASARAERDPRPAPWPGQATHPH